MATGTRVEVDARGDVLVRPAPEAARKDTKKGPEPKTLKPPRKPRRAK
jgi:hypothetical protein